MNGRRVEVFFFFFFSDVSVTFVEGVSRISALSQSQCFDHEKIFRTNKFTLNGLLGKMTRCIFFSISLSLRKAGERENVSSCCHDRLHQLDGGLIQITKQSKNGSRD